MPKGGWPLPVTPGQPTPGDPSYITETCRNHVLSTEEPYPGLSGRRGDPNHPPGWGKKHPNSDDLELIKAAVEAEGGKFCPYLTKECVVPEKVYKRWMSNKKLPGGGRWITNFFTNEQFEELPSLPPGTFGTCALVSLADTIQRVEWGKIIDAHDTVLRVGHPPIKGFERHVGSRVDVVIGRGATLGEKLPPGYENVAYTLGASFVGTNATAVVPWGLPKLWEKDTPVLTKELIKELYKRMVDPMPNKPRGPTTGIGVVLGVAFSALCTRLDVYGMSPYNGGHYFCNKGSTHTFQQFYTTSSCGKLQFVHSPGIENWLLHYLSKNFPQLNTCVYL